jgi:hypothetical protein
VEYIPPYDVLPLVAVVPPIVVVEVTGVVVIVDVVDVVDPVRVLDDVVDGMNGDASNVHCVFSTMFPEHTGHVPHIVAPASVVSLIIISFYLRKVLVH